MNTIIVKKEIEVPVGVLIDVADLLLEHDIEHKVIATDSDEETITLEISYEKEQRDIFHEITDLIEDHSDNEDDEEEDDEND